MSGCGPYSRHVVSWVDGFEFDGEFSDLREGEGATHARALQAELKSNRQDLWMKII